MDWRQTGFDWNRARAFLVTAEEGSLSAAAKALGQTQPTLGRQVAALEEELGVTLFRRAGRRLVLTDAGRALLEHVREMGAAARRFALAAGGLSESLAGRVAITASEIYACHLLPPLVAELRRQAPGIEIEIVASDEALDLDRGEADIAIRNVRPEQPDLIARHLCDDRARFYAAPALLDRLGTPRRTADLARGEFAAFASPERLRAWMNQLGIPVTDGNFPVRSTSHAVHWALVRSGAAIGVVPEWLGDGEPLVVRLLESLPPFAFPVWLVAHRELRTSPRVRLVFDFLAREIPVRLGAAQLP